MLRSSSLCTFRWRVRWQSIRRRQYLSDRPDRKPHQKPAAHIGGFGAHCRHKRAELTPSKIKIGRIMVVLGTTVADIEHGAKINNNGDHNTNVFCCHVCHSFLSQNVQYIVKLYHNKGISSRNKSLVKIHIYFV